MAASNKGDRELISYLGYLAHKRRVAWLQRRLRDMRDLSAQQALHLAGQLRRMTAFPHQHRRRGHRLERPQDW